jgi:hypothetical protein
MSAAEKIPMPTSPEAEVIRQIEVLIRKLATGDADDSDKQLLQALQRRRVNLMRPKMYPRSASIASIKSMS